jgi:predicted RNA binding protein YcfA (HicA-like mRNA interferase family)
MRPSFRLDGAVIHATPAPATPSLVSPDLPRVSGATVVRALERAGFVFRSQRGSHRKAAPPDGRTAIVPMHREPAPGTLRSILKQAGLGVAELRDLL